MPRSRDPFRLLENWLRESRTPMFVVERGGALRWFNAGCEQLTGRVSDEVRGEICVHSTAADVTTLAALLGALSPPPDLWTLTGQDAREGRDVAAYIPHRSGEITARRIRFVPLEDGGTEPSLSPAAVLGVILPWREPEAGVTQAEDWHAELAAARADLRRRHALSMLVCRSPATRRLLGQIELARPLDCHLLLVGEPGVGKEHIARTIHFSGPAKGQWFVPLECGLSPAEELRRVLTRLLERHETPATAARAPLPGTVFLDEVDRLPRDLQEQIVVSLSLPEPERPRLRFMGATYIPLAELVADDRLRPDFRDLISPLVLDVPPLRERRDDIPLLAQHFLEDLNRGRSEQSSGFAKAVLEQFAEYGWPGNVDELSRVVREAREAASGPWIDTSHLPFRFRTGLGSQRTPPPREPFGPIRMDEILARCEKELIERALTETRQNLSRAAELLGINRPRLYRRMEQLGLIAEAAKGEGEAPGLASEDPAG